MCFSATFWNERYETQQTGWDLKAPSTPLQDYIDQMEDKSIRILIPGCGNAYEAEYLIEKGFTNITLVDISDVLTAQIQEKFKAFPQVKVLNQDFFTLEEPFDLIIEQTFFCALNPDLRPAYVKKMQQLLPKNGKLVGVLFQRDFGNPFPPFGGSKAEYEALFSPLFEIHIMEDCYNSIPPRAGSELFIRLQPKDKSFIFNAQ